MKNSKAVKVMKEAAEDAKKASKRSRWAKQYENKPTKEIKKGIRSFEKQINIHQDKIKSPEKYNSGWETFNPERKQRLLNTRWPNDIKRQKEQKALLEKILKDRGEL